MESLPILMGKRADEQWLVPAYGNQRPRMTGATGTGKTVTLQVLAIRGRRRFSESQP